ncbi:uncharacterized protein LOC142236417 [Haematobia irritans]|uniref:uncharacterized protein LOC142236417 n=1 Tax=Haematobia irritans TaxID=7368 RepID=UPI003F4F5E67
MIREVYAEILDLGKRPSWYPDDGPEIEAECVEDHSISKETLDDIKKLHIDNTPTVRAYLLCYLKETNVYRPEKGPELRRIAWSLKEYLKLNKCDADMIRDCIEEHGAQDLKDYAYFHIIKCAYEKAPDRCLAKVKNN